MRKPYFRKDRGCWFVKTADGRSQIRLHEDEAQAHRIWQEVVAAERPESPQAPVAAIVENFLRHAERHIAHSTYSSYAYYLADFCGRHGLTLVRDLKPYDVTKWLDSKSKWGTS